MAYRQATRTRGVENLVGRGSRRSIESRTSSAPATATACCPLSRGNGRSRLLRPTTRSVSPSIAGRLALPPDLALAQVVARPAGASARLLVSSQTPSCELKDIYILYLIMCFLDFSSVLRTHSYYPCFSRSHSTSTLQ